MYSITVHIFEVKKMHLLIITIILFMGTIIGILLLCFLLIILYARVLLWKRPVMKLYEQRRAQADFCPYSEIPERLIRYITLTEDKFFFKHNGYRRNAIKGAFKINRQAKTIITGGSTITQQLAKNLYFHFRKSYFRKAVELIITINIERKLDKEKILEFYLNIIYFGNGRYGITDAAQFYFSKPVSELSINQMFLLSCIPSAPTAGNPIQHPDVFIKIRNRWLDNIDPEIIDISNEEIETIASHPVEQLDPQLRENDDYTRNYSQTIVMTNERFGPFRRKECIWN